MLSEERKIQICRMLDQSGSLQLRDLAGLFRVSAETIRRDLLDLEQKGHLKRIHGGAISVSHMLRPKELSVRMNERQKQKRELSLYAADFISEGDVIAIDSGSTANEFVKVVVERFDKLTVVTHSLDVVSCFQNFPNIQVIVCGGYYLQSENAFYGQFVLDTLDRIRINKAFLFPVALSIDGGIMDYEYNLQQVQKKYMDISDNIFFLADSSKFEKTALIKLTDIHPKHTIVTDSELPEEIYISYCKKKIKVVKDRYNY